MSSSDDDDEYSETEELNESYDEEDKDGYCTSAWLSSLAVFGDSPQAVALSLCCLLCSIFLSLWLNQNGNSTPLYSPWQWEHPLEWMKVIFGDTRQRQLGPLPKLGPPVIYPFQPSCAAVGDNSNANASSLCDEKNHLQFLDQIKRAYRNDGVVAVRGLISPDLLQQLDDASWQLMQTQLEAKQQTRGKRSAGTQFFSAHHGVVFHDTTNLSDDNDTANGTFPPFLRAAVDSMVPQLAALLLSNATHPTTNIGNLRLFRDILLAKDTDPYVCGYHVDDFGFWPATPDAPGINAWIALDSMPLEHGGGFALAIGSHTAPWREEAHYVTGASTTSPPQGFESAQDMIDRRTGSGTCNLETAAPHLHERMEQTKRVYSVQRGDVIFHERWLFHRTIAFARSFVESYNDNDNEDKAPLVYRRLSLRYNPGSSRIPRGYGTEPSVLWDPNNGGKTADQVCHETGPWYPQAWPHKDKEEIRQLKAHVEHKLHKAYELQDERKREMGPLLAKFAREQARRRKSTQ